MGLISGSSSLVKSGVSKLSRWLGWGGIKQRTRNTAGLIKSLVTPQTATRKESFKEAMTRLNLSEEDIKKKQKEFLIFYILFTAISGFLLLYSFYIGIWHRNWYSFLMGIGVTSFTLSQAFRYSFWYLQLKKRKLGHSLKDWYNENFKKA